MLANSVLSRRAMLRTGALLAAAVPLLAACGAAPRAGGTTARASTGQTTGAASAASGSVAPTPTFVPVTAALPSPATSPARLSGRWTVLQDQDFQPAMNAYVRKAIEDFARFQGWALDTSYVAGFSAGGDLFQKLGAAVNAGTPPDLLGKDLSGYQMKFLGLLEPLDDLAREMIARYGEPMPGTQNDTLIDGKWWGVPWFTRSGGYWGRKSWFDEAGLDMVAATDTLEGLPEALLKISDPGKRRYGWGMTINTCGDGESVVQSTCMMFGSRLTDESGQVVRLDSPETVRAVTWLTSIYTDPKYRPMLPPGVNSWTDPSNNEAWLAGQIGFASNAGTLYAQSRQEGNLLGDDTYLLQQPAGPDGARLRGANCNRFWVFKGSKNVEGSKDFIRYMLDPVAQEALWTYTPGYVLPAYTSGWDDPIIQAERNSKAFQPVALATPPYNGISYPGKNTAAAAAVNSQNVYTKMTARVLGGMPAADSVKQAAQQAVQIYQQYGLKGKE